VFIGVDKAVFATSNDIHVNTVKKMAKIREGTHIYSFLYKVLEYNIFAINFVTPTILRVRTQFSDTLLKS
jgi:hypothetical protein